MVTKTVLDNGVRIVTETVPGVHSVSIGIWIMAGSRHETIGDGGIAHFIEHMVFKGSARYSALEIARVIDSVGGILNAFTTKEYTCYYVKVLRQHLPLAVDLLCEIYFNSLFEQVEIEKERNVIIQEINMVKDTPDDFIQEIFNQRFFGSHPLGNSTLGECATVLNFNREQIVNFFSREYLRPEQIIITAAGNVEHQDILDAVTQRFALLAGSASTRDLRGFAPQKNILFHEQNLEQVHVCIGTIGVSQTDPARYSLYVLNTILGGSMSSRLFQEVRENRGLAYSIFSFMASFGDTGQFGVYLGVTEQTLREAVSLVMNEFAAVRKNGINKKELTHAQEQLKGNMLLALESTDSRMSRLAKCELYFNDHVTIESILGGINAVTATSVQELAEHILQDEYFTYAFLGPANEATIPRSILAMQ